MPKNWPKLKWLYVTTEAFATWQTHKKYGERATSETWIEEATSQMGLGKIRTDQFLANDALFHYAVLAYNTVRWIAQLSANNTLCQWEPETLQTYLIRTATDYSQGKISCESKRLPIHFILAIGRVGLRWGC